MDPDTTAAKQEPRAYQREMLHESLQRNIIVAMDTGSGKTKVAILRIAEEAKRNPDTDKLIWFLCPGVLLAEQQYNVIRMQLPALPALLLLGSDGVDLWSTQRIWDDVLRNQKIIVSTFQVLLDALKNAFVTMSRLSLLIADEAHHCADGHPLNRTMHGFYHPDKAKGKPVPAILGLTATAVMKSDVRDMFIIEGNLDAICRTPKATVEALLEHVHRPDMIPEMYGPSEAPTEKSLFETFNLLLARVDNNMDPNVKHVITTKGLDSREYEKAAIKRKTWCQGLFRSVVSVADGLHEELGTWASDQYLIRCRVNLQIEKSKLRLDPLSNELHRQEVDWMLAFFDEVGVPRIGPGAQVNTRQIASKSAKLIQVLRREMKHDSAAIVFAQTKASVQLLFELLQSHNQTKGLLRVGKLVGLSKGTERSGEVNDIYEVDDRAQSSLVDLKSGTKNLLVCTSVAEEGLDISACNLVICFEPPKSLKSFVQRRGRARAKDSKYIVLFDARDKRGIQNFQALEEQMKALYADEMRILDSKARKETQMTVNKTFRVDKTGAMLTADDAIGRLHHFTAKLPNTKFGNVVPSYSFTGPDEEVICTITLPNTLDASIRTWRSSQPWNTEQQAKKDTAFVAYVGLHKHGLVNDHLLPDPIIDDDIAEALQPTEHSDGVALIELQHDPMELLARAWASASMCYTYACDVPSRNLRLFMILPVMVSNLPPVRLYIDETETVDVSFSFRGCRHTCNTVEWASRTTRELLMAMFSSRMDVTASRFPILFSPSLESHDVEIWLAENTGFTGIQDLLSPNASNSEGKVLVRQRNSHGRPCVFVDLVDHEVSIKQTDPESTSDEKVVQPCVMTIKMPARIDFLHPVASDKRPRKPDVTFHYLPVDVAVVDKMQPSYAFFASLFPSIMHHVGRRVIAQELCNNLLVPAKLQDTALVLEGITTTSAAEDVNYQRIEFLGDAVLGFCVTISLLAQHHLWHEGYLTRAKEHCVSNSHLTKASQETGLARYILTKKFAGQRWRPPHNEQFNENGSIKTREVSTKTMADVVEALIGVADVVGGIPMAFRTIEVFLGQHSTFLTWKDMTLETRVAELQAKVRKDIQLPDYIGPVQELVGHTFKFPALLIEAITHNSCTSESAVVSYERLEFAGDSILSIIVTRLIYHSRPPLSVDRMHLLRTAAVNGHFLAFMSMRRTTSVARSRHVRPDRLDKSQENGGCYAQEVQKQLSFHDFILNYPSEHFAVAKKASVKRFETLRTEIESVLEAGQRYPWTLLAKFCPEKWFSDIVESVLCAIFIDTAGDLDACTGFLERLGIIKFLEDAIRTEMWVMHPKQELNKTSVEKKMDYKMIRINEEGVRDEIEPAELDEEDTVACRLSLGEEFICTASGRDKFAAQTKAAEKALRILDNEAKS